MVNKKTKVTQVKVNLLIKKKFSINLKLMPNKMIPFLFEIKITHSDFCFYGIYYSDKERQSGTFFLFYFIISIFIGIRTHCVA